VFGLQVLHELDTITDTIGLENDKVKPAAGIGRVCLSGEVYELRKGATNLPNIMLAYRSIPP
jgi:hypothetical protein